MCRHMLLQTCYHSRVFSTRNGRQHNPEPRNVNNWRVNPGRPNLNRAAYRGGLETLMVSLGSETFVKPLPSL